MAQTIVLRNNPAYKEGSLLGYDLNSQSRFNPVPITLSRDSEAYVEKNGVLTRVNPEVPRIDSDGALLVEPQRTNLVANTNTFTGIGGGSSAPSSETAPDGSTDATDVTFGAGANDGAAINNFAVTSGTTYQVTLYYKLVSSGGGDGTFDIRLDDPSAGLQNSGNFTPTSEWQRAVFEYTASGTGTTANNRVRPKTGSAAGDVVAFFGHMAEAGSYPTSWIKTEGATATRSADVVSQTGLANLLGDAEGSLYVEAAFFDNTTGRISLSDGTINNRVFLFASGGSSAYNVTVGGVSMVNSAGSAISDNNFYKLAFRYVTNDFALYQDGLSVVTDTSGSTYPDATLTVLKLADATGGSPFYGKIKALAVYDTALDNTELANITTNGI